VVHQHPTSPQFSRDWELDGTLAARLVIAALEKAIAESRPPPGLVHHSDRGVQCACDQYVRILNRHGMIPSMSRPANPYDNASCESFMKTLKREEIFAGQYQDLDETLFRSLKVQRQHDERFQAIRQAMDEVLSWLLWYNRQRTALNPELSQPHGVRTTLGERTFISCCMMDAGTEADGGNADRWKERKTIKPFPHPSHQPWKSSKPISTFPPSQGLRRDEFNLKNQPT